MRKTFFAISLAGLLLMSFGVAFEASAQESETVLAKKTRNPVANLIIIPLQNRMNFGVGPNNRMQNVLNVRRVVPLYRPVLHTLYCRRQTEGKAGYVTSHVGFRLVWD